MKLYLSSYRIPDSTVLAELVGKPLAVVRVGIIPNAKDYYATRARRVKIRLVTDYMQVQGMQPGIIDLNDYTDASKLAAELKKYDLLWVMGGNTFCLREAMYGSGFDTAIHEAMDAGVVYAGESAGTCVAGTDLKGIELADDPEYAETVIWKGLRLTPKFFIPHADNTDLRWAIQPVLDSRGNEPDTVVLNDNDAWVVDGQNARKISGPKPDETEMAAA